MANTFNLVTRGVMLEKLRAISGDIIQFISFVRAFFVFEFALFYSHCNREGDVAIIPSTMGTHQSDPLWGHYSI
jgi:hypothetical protein